MSRLAHSNQETMDEIGANSRGELWKSGILKFGKYQGHTVAEVLSINPGYLLWIKKNVTRITIAQPIIDEAIEATKITRKVRGIHDPFNAFGNDDEDDDSGYIGFDYGDFGNN